MDNLDSPKSMLEFLLGWYFGLCREMIEDPAADDDTIYDGHLIDMEEIQRQWRKKYKNEITDLMGSTGGGSFENTRDF